MSTEAQGMERSQETGLPRGGREREGRPRSSVRGESPRTSTISVTVDERGLEPALRAFKKMIQKDGLLKDLKRRRFHEKPGERRRRKAREAASRRRRRDARARSRR